jgi:subtilisin family serine protease
MRRYIILACLAISAACERSPLTAPATQAAAVPGSAVTGVNVLLSQPATSAILNDLSTIGPVVDQIPSLNAVTIRASVSQLDAVRAKPYVSAAEIDTEVRVTPVTALAATNDFSDGRSSWDQDAIGVTMSPGFTGRNPELGGLTGEGVYVGILDSGLLSSWQSYFPTDRIATQYARSFGGGGGDVGTISSQPNKWQQDTDSHGTHVTSTVLGYMHSAGAVNGTAPLATVIPVKILNQQGSGWWSVIARGLVYLTDLKTSGEIKAPMVVNMSIVGGRSVLMERAIDYAIRNDVIVVVAAGNGGKAGMAYPGAYAPTISVAAYGFTDQFEDCTTGQPRIQTWWRLCDVADPTDTGEFYIASFSARPRAGQQVDIAGPGDNVVGPYQYNNGQTAWFFLSGTSMATPHVAGVVALMLEKNATLSHAAAEDLLKRSAIRFGAGTRSVFDPSTNLYGTQSWVAADAGAGLLDAVGAVKAVR